MSVSVVARSVTSSKVYRKSLSGGGRAARAIETMRRRSAGECAPDGGEGSTPPERKPSSSSDRGAEEETTDGGADAVEGDATAVGDASSEEPASANSERVRPGSAADGAPSLVVRIDGAGSFGAHKLRATYVDAGSLRTQTLYVKGDASLQVAQLRDVLRALQPVLNFELDARVGDAGAVDSADDIAV